MTLHEEMRKLCNMIIVLSHEQYKHAQASHTPPPPFFPPGYPHRSGRPCGAAFLLLGGPSSPPAAPRPLAAVPPWVASACLEGAQARARQSAGHWDVPCCPVREPQPCHTGRCAGCGSGPPCEPSNRFRSGVGFARQIALGPLSACSGGVNIGILGDFFLGGGGGCFV